MDEKRFRIKGNSIRTLYSDDLLGVPGLQVVSVTRASNVEFDEFLKGWTVQFADGAFLSDVDEGNLAVDAEPAFCLISIRHKAKAFPTRQAALDAEVAFLNRRLSCFGPQPS